MEQYPIEIHIKIQWKPSHLLTNQKAKQNESRSPCQTWEAIPEFGYMSRLHFQSQTELFFSPSLTFIPGACVHVRRQMTLEEGRPHPLCLLPRGSALERTMWVVASPNSSAGHQWAVPLMQALRGCSFQPLSHTQEVWLCEITQQRKAGAGGTCSWPSFRPLHSDFWAAQGEEVHSPPPHRLLDKRASLRACFHRGPCFIS